MAKVLSAEKSSGAALAKTEASGKGNPMQDIDPSTAHAVSPALLVKMLTRVAAFYHRTFMESPEGLAYLTQERGIRDVSHFKTFQVGLANGGLVDVLPTDAQSVTDLKSLGVLTESGDEFFKGCVVFPLWNAEGAIINLYGRRLVDGEINHLFLRDEKHGLEIRQ